MISPPIVVYGTGGSGTRAMSYFLAACGISMGKVNGSGDARAFVSLLQSRVDEVLSATQCVNYQVEQVNQMLAAEVVAEYEMAASTHTLGMLPQERWGFKNPRHIFLVPFIDRAFAGARFVHVIRDGRDMLLSRNKNQPRKHFEHLFGYPFQGTAADIANFWAKTNIQAREFGISQLGDRYLAIRIEDLCSPDRSSTLEMLAARLGFDSQVASRHSEIFVAQDSFGRGHESPNWSELPSHFQEALAAFRYS